MICFNSATAALVELDRPSDPRLTTAACARPEDSGEQLITLFTQVVPFPEAGVNSMRTEVLLTAFAQDVIIRNGVNRTVIAGRVGLDGSV